MKNLIKTFILIMLMTALLMIIGYYFAGAYGLAFGLGIALIINIFSYWFSDKIILKMYNATEVDQLSVPELYRIVDDLAHRAEIPTPRVYLTPHRAPNAFATGRNPEHGVVVVTRGLYDSLDQNELKAVIAHELSHIKHYDMLIHMIAATMAGAISAIAYMARWSLIFFGGRKRGLGALVGSLVLLILAPIVAMLIQLAISRSREFAADQGSGEITGQPLALASALKKISAYSQADLRAGRNTAHFFITSPLKKNFLLNLFRTHPPIEERVKRLEKQAYGSLD